MRLFSCFTPKKIVLSLCTAMILFFVIIGSFLSLTVVHADDGQAAFDIKPLYYDPHNPVTGAYFVFGTKSGGHIQNSMLVTNVGSATGTVNLYPVDAFTSDSGGTAFRGRMDTRSDVGAWIELSRQQVTLAPGQSQAVSFEVNVPAHIRSGQHVGGIVAQGASTHVLAQKNIPISLQQLRVVAVQINLPGPQVEKLVATAIQPDNASKYQCLQVKLSNTGNMMVKASGNLQIFDLHQHLLRSQAVSLDTILPQMSINDRIYIQQQALPVGQYRAALTLTYGQKRQLSYTNTFAILSTKKTFSGAISRLVAGDSEGFMQMVAPWQLAVGGMLILLVICTLGFWMYRLSRLLIGSGRNRKDAATVAASISELVTHETPRARK